MKQTYTFSDEVFVQYEDARENAGVNMLDRFGVGTYARRNRLNKLARICGDKDEYFALLQAVNKRGAANEGD